MGWPQPEELKYNKKLTRKEEIIGISIVCEWYLWF